MKYCDAMEALLTKHEKEMDTFEIIATLGKEECQLGRDIRTTFLGDPFCFESKSESDSLDGTNGEEFDLHGAILKLKESEKKKKLAIERSTLCDKPLKGECGVYGELEVKDKKTLISTKMERQLLEARVNALRRESKEHEKLRQQKNGPNGFTGWAALVTMRHVSNMYKTLRKQLPW